MEPKFASGNAQSWTARDFAAFQPLQPGAPRNDAARALKTRISGGRVATGLRPPVPAAPVIAALAAN
ncbi:hypothetical protein ACFFJB_07265 [Camelimonas abortus]|uniref:Uncharacterized protein n=1 Tax=Camelimonas abortus TaxID=1017184 RepID=A0ABV7LGT2_9HYPH